MDICSRSNLAPYSSCIAARTAQSGQLTSWEGFAEAAIRRSIDAAILEVVRMSVARLQLPALGHNQATILHCIELSAAMADWSLTSLQPKLIKILGWLVRCWQRLTERPSPAHRAEHFRHWE